MFAPLLSLQFCFAFYSSGFPGRLRAHSHGGVPVPGNFQRLHCAGTRPRFWPSQDRGTFVSVAQQPCQPLEQGKIRTQKRADGLNGRVPVWEPMVSGKQPLSLIQARSNYKLVGQSFGSFVSALAVLAQCSGKLHSLSVGRHGGKTLSTAACCPFSQHQQAQQMGLPFRKCFSSPPFF